MKLFAFLRFWMTVIVALIWSAARGHAQAVYVRPNESIILSFKTTGDKQAYLVRDKADKYAMYRFGTLSKIEFTYPSPLRPPKEAFEYAFYLRGGGVANAGLDLNSLAFRNGRYRYVVYETYSAEDNEYRVGIKVLKLNTHANTHIPGMYSSKKGTLAILRDIDLVGKSEALLE